LRIRHWYHNGYPYLSHAAEAADAVSKPEDLFVCNERTSSVFLYYLDRKGWAWSIKEAGAQKSEELLAQKISEGAKFYISEKAMLTEVGLESFRDHLYSSYELVYDRDDLLVFRLKGS
jgi:hypothetical protein